VPSSPPTNDKRRGGSVDEGGAGAAAAAAAADARRPLPTHTATQLCLAAASIFSISNTPTQIQLWARLTSTSKHRPSTDPILVKSGDIIHIASPCRGARRVDDFEAIIRYCDQNGLMLTTAAVGMYVGAPVYVLSAGGLVLSRRRPTYLRGSEQPCWVSWGSRNSGRTARRGTALSTE